jgi:hypothetical protein
MKEAKMDKACNMHDICYKCIDLLGFNWEKTTPEICIYIYIYIYENNVRTDFEIGYANINWIHLA